jgi:hypothetical protein
MSRFLFTPSALGFLGGAVLFLVRGDGHLALASIGAMVVMFVFAVIADRKGEGMPTTPPPSAP